MPLLQHAPVQGGRFAVQSGHDVQRDAACHHRGERDGVMLVLGIEHGFQADSITRPQHAHDALGAVRIDAVELDHAAAQRINAIDVVSLQEQGRAGGVAQVVKRRVNHLQLVGRQVAKQGAVATALVAVGAATPDFRG